MIVGFNILATTFCLILKMFREAKCALCSLYVRLIPLLLSPVFWDLFALFRYTYFSSTLLVWHVNLLQGSVLFYLYDVAWILFHMLVQQQHVNLCTWEFHALLWLVLYMLTMLARVFSAMSVRTFHFNFLFQAYLKLLWVCMPHCI